MPRKTTHARRMAAARLRMIPCLPGFVTEEQARHIAQWQAQADEAIEAEESRMRALITQEPDQ